MQYYAFELDDESKEMCTRVTPVGKYKYNRLPMGLKRSPGIAQEVMEIILGTLMIPMFTQMINKMLGSLNQNGFSVNPLKYEWGVKEIDWLDY